jgi:hypothetical protein
LILTVFGISILILNTNRLISNCPANINC